MVPTLFVYCFGVFIENHVDKFNKDIGRYDHDGHGHCIELSVNWKARIDDNSIIAQLIEKCLGQFSVINSLDCFISY